MLQLHLTDFNKFFHNVLLGDEAWCQGCTQFFQSFHILRISFIWRPGDEGSGREFTEITISSIIFGGRGVTSPNSTNSPILLGGRRRGEWCRIHRF